MRTPPSEGPARRPAGKHALKLKTCRDGWQVRQVPMTHLDIPQLIKDHRTGLLLYCYIRPHGRWCDLRSFQWESFLAEYLCDWTLHLPWSLSSRRFHFPVKKLSTCTAPALGFGPWLFDCACIARERLRIPSIFNHVPKVSKSCHSASPKIMVVPLWSSAQNACKLQIHTLWPLGRWVRASFLHNCLQCILQQLSCSNTHFHLQGVWWSLESIIGQNPFWQKSVTFLGSHEVMECFRCSRHTEHPLLELSADEREFIAPSLRDFPTSITWWWRWWCSISPLPHQLIQNHWNSRCQCFFGVKMKQNEHLVV